ncbi:MAG: aspartate-semialdehyde dehydrogenase [bacterium]
MSESTGLKIAVVGATGLVGRTMLKVLEERQIPCRELAPIASAQSRGGEVHFNGRSYLLSTLEDGEWEGSEVALFSAGSSVASEWIPRISDTGVYCIDNSSAFRQEIGVPLVVPEVNDHDLMPNFRVIANPNCSTIQLVMVLGPLHKHFQLEEVVVATYQSVSGAGQRGLNQLLAERSGQTVDEPEFVKPIFDNIIPSIGKPAAHGLCFEEWKMIHETRKILAADELRVYPFTVRVPVAYCHCEAVHLKFKEPVDVVGAREILASAQGVTLMDDLANDVYPTPHDCVGKDDVFVGRLYQLPQDPTSLDCWIVSDNVRKGAATNAVQILEALIEKQYLK